MDNQKRINIKSDIELAQYASYLGYEFLTKDSTPRLTAMKHPNGDKILIPERKGTDWLYYSVTDDHRGTIFDLAINNNVGDAKTVHREILQWAGNWENINLPEYNKKMHNNTVEADFKKLNYVYDNLKPVTHHPYLTNKRKISKETQEKEIFRGRFYQNKYGGVAFPQLENGKVNAIEIKSEEFNGFLKGSRKSFWHSNKTEKIKSIIICENPIDALSYDEIKKPDQPFYIGISGGTSPETLNKIKEEIDKIDAQIILCFDNDKQGLKYDDSFKELLNGRKILVNKPNTRIGDWNAELKEIKQRKGVDHSQSDNSKKEADREFYLNEARKENTHPENSLNTIHGDERDKHLEKRVYALKDNNNEPKIFVNIITAEGDKHSYRRRNALLSAIDSGQESFQNINLKNTPITKVSINKILFEDVDFSGSNLSGSDFSKCKFINCKFENTLIEKTDLKKCLFENCNFKNSKLNESNLSNAKLDNITLDNTELNNVRATGVSFNEAENKKKKSSGRSM